MFFKNLKPWMSRIVLILALLGGMSGGLPAEPVQAATLIVTNTNDSGHSSQRQAIVEAASGDTIPFIPTLAGQTITLTSGYDLPAAIRYVNWDATGANNGTSWANAFVDLQSALAVAMSGDEVWVAAGTYKPTADTDRSQSFVLKNGVAIYGGFAGTEISRDQRDYETNLTVLSGDIGVEGDKSDNSYHVLIGSLTNNSAILDGFTVTGGKTQETLSLSPEHVGGGMYNKYGGPSVANVIFIGNEAAFGGGMYNGGDFLVPESGAEPILTNVIFQNNSAFEGGGLFNENYVYATLTDVTFDNNSATRAGGGMEDRLGTLSLTNVVFKNNAAGLAAGGMQNFSIDAKFVNVTFKGNSATMYGGGMVNANNDPTFTNILLEGNSADVGGGMWNHQSSPILTDVAFNRNTGVDTGGGIYNEAGSSPVLTNVTFTENAAGSGSGMFNSNSSPSLLNVTFGGNVGSAGSRGGAMVNDLNSSPSLTSVTFVNNSVTFIGGAMLNSYSSNPSLVNVTFVGNSSSDRGGAIYNWESSPILKNVTIHGNSSGVGGAIYNDENSNPSIVNSILYGDTGGEIYNNSGTAVVTDSIVQGGYTGSGNIDNDPLLGPLQDNGGFTQTMALGAGSPAIDTGEDVSCPANDQRGVSRPQGDHCDIGAFEYEKEAGGPLPTTPSFTDVPMSHPYFSDIEILYANGLTAGCMTTPLKFCPDQTMDRAQSAVFMLRGSLGVGYEPPTSLVHRFKDNWTPGPWAEKWAEGMFNAGLTAGCTTSGPLKFCPWEQMPREQAVIFGLRLKYGNAYTPPPATGTLFADMTDTSYYATKWAEQAYTDGLIPSCGMSGGKPKFCPRELVTRGLGGYIIVRAKDLSMP